VNVLLNIFVCLFVRRPRVFYKLKQKNGKKKIIRSSKLQN